ncbi:MAG: hypothetical protein D3903_01435 [Candidatus Electrothrix sp. GM3_4]|nr:hypothetical protein [Candidatus Electrothrix sp. GM3_4]
MKRVLIGLIIAWLAGLSSVVLAGDLDDDISKYTDDSISKADELGKADKNIKFIVLNAKSKAASGKDTLAVTGGSNSGYANLNSVLLGAGSNVKGDIIIIDQSKGDKVNVATD